MNIKWEKIEGIDIATCSRPECSSALLVLESCIIRTYNLTRHEGDIAGEIDDGDNRGEMAALYCSDCGTPYDVPDGITLGDEPVARVTREGKIGVAD